MHTNKPEYYRASFFDFSIPVKQKEDLEASARFIDDGLLAVCDGHITWFGEWTESKKILPQDACVHDYSGRIIMPGFIDAHVHYPQVEMIGSYGEQLLEWLNTYTFPTEARYKDKNYALEMAQFFLQQLFRSGTTTALVFATVFPASVEALFESAEAVNMRLITGKVMMDRNAPDYLCDTPESSYADSRRLIEKWHKRARLLYAVTPRFAPTSSPEQMQAVQRLLNEFDDVYLQTHLCENVAEIAWVKELYPEREGYLDVYDWYGMTGERSVFAHSIHLQEHEWQCLAKTNSAVAFCPTSNLFLGSGLFNMRKAWDSGVKVGLGTDVGAGTSLCQLQTLGEAYKVQQLQGYKFSPFEALYHATLGSARALLLDELIGNFAVGKEADFIVVNPHATELCSLRFKRARTIAERLFALLTLGDDRHIQHTYVFGTAVHSAE